MLWRGIASCQLFLFSCILGFMDLSMLTQYLICLFVFVEIYIISRYIVGGPASEFLYILFNFNKPAIEVKGKIQEQYKEVADLFLENFKDGQEVGSQLCVYVKGEKVIDIYGFQKNNKFKCVDYSQDKIQNIFSSGKNVEALVIGILVDKGLLFYDEKVCTYWPEFGQQGKQDISISDVLRHEGGLCYLDISIDGQMCQLESIKRNVLGEILARQKPFFTKDSKRGYHAFTRGWILNEIVRRVDPGQRTIGEIFREEVANKFGIDFFYSLPENQFSKTSKLYEFNIPWLLFQSFLPSRFRYILPNFFSLIQIGLKFRQLKKLLKFENKVSQQHIDMDSTEIRKAEIPSANGKANAIALAMIASIFAQKGKFQNQTIISEKTWKLLHSEPSTKPDFNLMGRKSQFTKGGVNLFDQNQDIGTKGNLNNNYGNYGWQGFGGSVMQWNVEEQIGFGYAPNLLDSDFTYIKGTKLLNKVYECAKKSK